jgi:hypothetical protein
MTRSTTFSAMVSADSIEARRERTNPATIPAAYVSGSSTSHSPVRTVTTLATTFSAAWKSPEPV